MHAAYSELDKRFENGGPDLYAEKNRFSAFIQGASDIETQLRDNELDTLIITGTLSNICSETNARDAMMRGYKVVFASDANAALSDEEHLATLITVASTFGDVRPTNEILSLIGNSAAQAAQ